ncbi:MAG: sensor histidine kinase [Acutalibacteraceae bacterium]
MLKKLQHRFMKIVFLALVAIVSVQLIAVNTINIAQRDSDLRNILYLISENGGIFPYEEHQSDGFADSFFNPFKKVEITIETPYSTRYFVVKLQDNVVTSISTENIAAVGDQQAFEYAAQIYDKKPGYGFVDEYRYYYTKDEATGKSTMVFIDAQRELESSMKLCSVSFFIAVISILALIMPIRFLSKRAMRPVEKSIEKQRQFITDAGHELKTPIAIISADADVLEMCEGENEWITSIKNQTVRLDSLVKNLVTLSKLEEETTKPKTASFNLSDAVRETAESFETLIKSNNINIIYNITDGIMLNANESEIRQLISILCDNAAKYTTENGIFKISVYKSGKNICIDMYNDCEDIPKEKLDRLFDRFYRADSSRARETGGYGIGLSIAQVNVQRNKGKISAVSTKPNSITFKIVFKAD